MIRKTSELRLDEIKNYNGISSHLDALAHLIYSDFFNTLSTAVKQQLLNFYAQKLQLKIQINAEILQIPQDQKDTQKQLQQFRIYFPDYKLNIENFHPLADNNNILGDGLDWSSKNLFLYNQYRLKNIYLQSAQSAFLNVFEIESPTLAAFNQTSSYVSRASSAFINATREFLELCDISLISLQGSNTISFFDKFEILLKQRYKRLISDAYCSIINGLSFFVYQTDVSMRDKLTGLSFFLDTLLSWLEIETIQSHQLQFEQELRELLMTHDDETLQILNFIQKQHLQKLKKAQIEGMINFMLFVSFSILSGFYGLTGQASIYFNLIGALLMVGVQLSQIFLEHQQLYNQEDDINNKHVLNIKLYTNILNHCLFPILSLLTNLVLRPSLGFTLPHGFVLISLIGISKVLMDLINSMSNYHQQNILGNSREVEAALNTVKINAIKSFAMLELVGLSAWSQFSLNLMPQLLGLSPVTSVAIAMFLSLHLYAHFLESKPCNEDKSLTVSPSYKI